MGEGTAALASKLIDEDVGESSLNRIIWNENIDGKIMKTEEVLENLTKTKLNLAMTGQIFNYI